MLYDHAPQTLCDHRSLASHNSEVGQIVKSWEQQIGHREKTVAPAASIPVHIVLNSKLGLIGAAIAFG